MAFPDHLWEMWRFENSPKGWWTIPRHREQFFSYASSALSLQSLDSWYTVKKEHILSLGGSDVLNEFDGSLATALEETYPQHLWLPWKFRLPPRGWSTQIHLRQAFFEWLGWKLKLKDREQWYYVSPAQISENGGAKLNYLALPSAFTQTME